MIARTPKEREVLDRMVAVLEREGFLFQNGGSDWRLFARDAASVRLERTESIHDPILAVVSKTTEVGQAMNSKGLTGLLGEALLWG